MKVITMQIKNQDKIFGGAYRKYMELIEEFISRDWEVHHISPREFSNIKHRNLTHHGILDIPISPSFLPFFIQTLPKMLWIGTKTNIDIVVTFSSIECLLGIIFKFFNKRTKLVISFHADSIAGEEIRINNRLKKTIYIKILEMVEKIVLKKADLVIFVSNENRKNIMKRAEYNQIEKTKIIYNNITRRMEKLSEERCICFDINKKIIGFVGGLHEEGKGLRYLIKAFYKVKQEVSNSILVIVGDGPDKQKLISLVKNLNLEKDVIFTGFKDNPLQYMKGFDLMVLPSLHEACPLVIIEALYVGTPIIGSKVGGIPEVLKYGELLFEPKNVDELASKILNLLQNAEAYKKALELGEERKRAFIFDWGDEMVKAIEGVMLK